MYKTVNLKNTVLPASVVFSGTWLTVRGHRGWDFYAKGNIKHMVIRRSLPGEKYYAVYKVICNTPFRIWHGDANTTLEAIGKAL